MKTFNLTQNLLLENPSLKVIQSPFQWFYTYRSNAEFSDIDRSYTAKRIYKILNWYDEINDRNLLEPDTFFASSHFLISNLFKKYDKKYYVEDFKRYIKESSINYEELSNDSARHYRYLWMLENSTMTYYQDIVTNSSLLNYVDDTHKIGNFMIIPKNFGWNVKVKLCGESPLKSLDKIEKNWVDYTENYKSIYSFNELKEQFILEDFYLRNKTLNTALDIHFSDDSFPEIFEKMSILSKLIRVRTERIILRLEEIAKVQKTSNS